MHSLVSPAGDTLRAFRYLYFLMMSRLASILSAIALLVGAAPLLSQPIGPAQPVTFSADSSRATSGAGGASLVWTLMGNVRIVQGTTTITAEQGTWYEGAQQGVLTGNVRITQPGNTLTALRVDYNGISKMAVASGGVTIVDTGATITSSTAQYDMGRRTAQFSGGVTVLDSGARITSSSLDYDMSQRIARFRGNVTMRDSNTTLRADNGDYFSLEMKADFRGNVIVTNDSGSIRADHLLHWRSSQESFAVGNVVVQAPFQRSQLFGDTVHAFPQRNYTVATGKPRLVKIDSTALSPQTAPDSAGSRAPADSLAAVRFRYDTTIITARAMEAYRGEQEEYRATGNVLLTRGTLQAVGQIARFLSGPELITIGPGRNRAVADSAALPDSAAAQTPAPVTGLPGPDTSGTNPAATASRGDSLGSPFPTPVVWYDKSQITGDTITIGMKERKLEWIEVLHDAFAISEGKIPQRLDQLRGQRMLFTLAHDTIRQVRSEGEAASIYFNYDLENPDGAMRAVCDTMIITFDAGKAAQVETIGGEHLSDWEIVPEQNVQGAEASYRLEGFRRYDRLGNITPSAAQPQTSSVAPASRPLQENSTSQQRR